MYNCAGRGTSGIFWFLNTNFWAKNVEAKYLLNWWLLIISPQKVRQQSQYSSIDLYMRNDIVFVTYNSEVIGWQQQQNITTATSLTNHQNINDENIHGRGESTDWDLHFYIFNLVQLVSMQLIRYERSNTVCRMKVLFYCNIWWSKFRVCT